MGIGVVTRPGARICPGGPEHLPGLPGLYPDLTRLNESTIVFGIDTKQFLPKILLK